jgi:RNA polymerase sigma-70 factor, ECF subfamily
MDEWQLITAARIGDQNAFTELYHRHHRYVRAIGRSILHTDDLDDMCQETFLSAFTRLDTFEGDARFRTWITRIAVNRCLLILRNSRRPGHGESQAFSPDESAYTDNVRWIDARLESLPQRLDLERLLKTLTPAQREALEMAYAEEMPVVDIAAALKTTVAAVKGRIAIAKKKLKMSRRQ